VENITEKTSIFWSIYLWYKLWNYSLSYEYFDRKIFWK